MSTLKLSAKLDRTDKNTPWGFRLHGGKDFSSPLTIQRVSPVKVSGPHLDTQYGTVQYSTVFFCPANPGPFVFKGESFRPGTKISSNYKDHTFEVFI